MPPGSSLQTPKDPNKATDNPLDKSKTKEIPTGFYTDKDKEYIGFLQNRLTSAKQMRDQPYPEQDLKTYIAVYDENKKIASTLHLGKKQNRDDVVVSAGTVESKLDSLLSHINNLNLTPEILAFDKQNNKINQLGFALTDILHDARIRDRADGGGDREKRIARQRELLEQGTVFVQSEWLKLWEMKKTLTKPWQGEFKDVEWSEKLEVVFEGLSTTLLNGPSVYLGNITEYYMENQPYIYVFIRKDYEVAKKMFGKWENWDKVQKGKIPPNAAGTDSPQSIFDNKFRLSTLKDNQVEIIFYQDQARDEFQIIINGVLMMPVGFPLSAVTPRGEYNVIKQVFRMLSHKFAYGGAFVSSGNVKRLSALLDEMLTLFVLKTRKSITPAYVNTSGRVIDRKVLSPGRISHGIDAGALVPIAGNEVQGITAGEQAFF